MDNVCAFTSPGHVVLAWTDDMDDPQYQMSSADLEILENETDAKGRKIEVHKVYIPKKPVCITEYELPASPLRRVRMSARQENA